MGSNERRAREKDEVRQKILAAATELFLEDGYASVSMRKIAEKIEYAPSTLYLYFDDKRAICNAIAVEAFEILIRGLQEIEQRGMAPLETLAAGLRWYVDFGLQNPHQYRLVFGSTTPPEVEDAQTNQLGLEALQFLALCIGRCRAVGIFSPGDPMTDALAAWAQLHGLTSIMIAEYGRYGLPWPARDTLINRGIELMINGLR
jgi:AcrR family transcriptional regulator